MLTVCAGDVAVYRWHADEPGVVASGSHSLDAHDVRHARTRLCVQSTRTQGLSRQEGQGSAVTVCQWCLQTAQEQLMS